MTEQQLIQYLLQQGPWAVSFGILLWYLSRQYNEILRWAMQKNDEREKEMLQTLEAMSKEQRRLANRQDKMVEQQERMEEDIRYIRNRLEGVAHDA